SQQHGSVSRRTNYIIPLEEDYSTIYDRFTEDAKKNIRRTEASGLTASQDVAMDQVIRLFVEAYGEKNKHISRNDYARFKILAGQCIDRGYGFAIGIRDSDNDLVAAAFFGKDEKRVYYILGAPNQQGRKTNAVHSLIDEVIRKYAGSGLIFDFEGSDIPSVAQFYRKFSPMSRQYDLVQLNRLPRWLQHLRNRPDNT
ncbi:MAG TPA: GNAT family N-acetyltransferase, partial [Puia sp.]|nr:GNAT family N-acetyltransferase [Puia sp.]